MKTSSTKTTARNEFISRCDPTDYELKKWSQGFDAAVRNGGKILSCDCPYPVGAAQWAWLEGAGCPQS
jgi:hypothetical protein